MLIKTINKAMGANAPMAHEAAAQAAASRGEFTTAFKTYLGGLGLPSTIKTAQVVLIDARIPGIPFGHHARIARAVHSCTAHWLASTGKPSTPLPEWAVEKPRGARVVKVAVSPVDTAIKTLAAAGVLSGGQLAAIAAIVAAHGVTA